LAIETAFIQVAILDYTGRQEFIVSRCTIIAIGKSAEWQHKVGIEWQHFIATSQRILEETCFTSIAANFLRKCRILTLLDFYFRVFCPKIACQVPKAPN